MKGYKDIEKIGSGGMAVVYKATQESLGRVVAIKKMHPHLSYDDNFIQRFTIEAQSASSLHHQNIVTVHDFGKDEDETYFIVMEYLVGNSLEYHFSQNPFPTEIGLLIIRQICDGLSYAHQKNIVHRDIKPANIIITEDGVAKLTDFGIAYLKDFHAFTPAGAIIGTPSYISPEIIKGEKITPSADIFSIGVILYRLICKDFPFKGKTTAEILHNIVKEDFEDPTKKNQSCSEDTLYLINKSLCKNVEERFKTVDEIIEKLDNYLYKFDIVNPVKEVKNYVENPVEYSKKLKIKMINKHLEKGKLLQTQNKIYEAIKEFEAVLALDPTNTEVAAYLKKIDGKEYMISEETKLILNKQKKISFRFIAITTIIISAVIILLAFSIFFTSKFLKKHSVSQKENISNLYKSSTENIKNKLLIEPKQIKSEIKEEKLEKKEEVKKEIKENILFKKETLKKVNLSETKTKKPAFIEKKLEEYGYVSIFSHPWTEVYIDGIRHENNAPFYIPIKLTVGEHQLKLVNPESKSYQGTIIIEQNKKVHYKIILKDVEKGKWDVVSSISEMK